ncbi:MAG TPA: glycosyltransferase, partial [Candidatus Polarisedimenticolia bacterium]|nr:glycosyltransferase [Candidatus Polarisedimenticolia bacterium]
RRRGIAPSEAVFLMLGRLHREKGADLFLRALGALSGRATGRWRAVLVGDGPEREPLRRLAAELGVEARVFFAGARRRVGPWLEAADLLVLPSREEGLPVAPLEAMAREKPVLATAVGGTPEVVRHGETGLLVPADDPQALAAGLQRLLEDPDLRARFGARGLAILRADFSLERMVGQITALYEELLGRRRPADGVIGQAALLRAAGE